MEQMLALPTGHSLWPQGKAMVPGGALHDGRRSPVRGESQEHTAGAQGVKVGGSGCGEGLTPHLFCRERLRCPGTKQRCTSGQHQMYATMEGEEQPPGVSSGEPIRAAQAPGPAGAGNAPRDSPWSTGSAKGEVKPGGCPRISRLSDVEPPGPVPINKRPKICHQEHDFFLS